MPIPVSATVTVASAIDDGGDADSAVRLGVLRRVVQQVAKCLRKPGEVGIQPCRLGRQIHREHVPFCVDKGARRFGCSLEDGSQVDLFTPQIELVLRDA